MGGSLPLSYFDEVLAKPVLIVPIANADNAQHGPNENLRLGNLWYGVDLVATLLTQSFLWAPVNTPRPYCEQWASPIVKP